jgi:YHS domain-containing protein
MNPFNKTH